jgi:hypothetical protein
MGQQQLLLIVLGVIVVGIAVVAGINLFSASHDESIKDELVAQCMSIGANAQQFFIKPSSMGGGSNTFSTGGLNNAGYVIPSSMRNTTNCNSYAGTAAATSYTIVATPTPVSGKTYSFANVTCVVNPSGMTTTVN